MSHWGILREEVASCESNLQKIEIFALATFKVKLRSLGAMMDPILWLSYFCSLHVDFKTVPELENISSAGTLFANFVFFRPP